MIYTAILDKKCKYVILTRRTERRAIITRKSLTYWWRLMFGHTDHLPPSVFQKTFISAEVTNARLYYSGSAVAQVLARFLFLKYRGPVKSWYNSLTDTSPCLTSARAGCVCLSTLSTSRRQLGTWITSWVIHRLIALYNKTSIPFIHSYYNLNLLRVHSA